MNPNQEYNVQSLKVELANKKSPGFGRRLIDNISNNHNQNNKKNQTKHRQHSKKTKYIIKAQKNL